MKAITRIAKQLWLLVLAIGVVYYTVENFSEISTQISDIPFMDITLSILLLIFGRLLIVQLARDALLVTGSDRSYRDVFHAVAQSELGKYLPGGIWHFVGRSAYYNSMSIPVLQTSKAILLEHIWLVISAALGGCLMLLMFGSHTLLLVLVPTFMIAWYILLRVTVRHKDERQTNLLVRAFIIQVGIWLSLGLSFAMLLPQLDTAVILLTLGAFAVSWLIGFLTVFAPGGLGTREVSIALLMLPLFDSATILILSGIHRLLWILVEMLLGIIAVVLERRVQLRQ
jgi:uncharacterized membrane protein YbhN (UPF0104 family)